MDAYACTWLFTVYFGIKAVYINNHMYIYIYTIYIYTIYIYIQYISSLTKLVYWNVCKFEFKLKKSGRGGIGGEGAAPPPQSRLETPIFTCKVLGWMWYSSTVKVYILHDMQLGNMWNVDWGTTMHNRFIWCYHRVGLRSLYIRFGSGLAWGLNIIRMIMQTF